MSLKQKTLSLFRVLWELLRSIPLLTLAAAQLKLTELKGRIKKMSEKLNQGPKSGRTQTQTGTQPVSAGEKRPLSPFEIEEGRTAGAEAAQSLGGPSGTTSPGSSVQINPRVAGQLLNIPFRVAHAIYPVAQPLTEGELEAMSEPFSDFLVEMGWEKIGKSSIVLGFHLFIAGYSRVRAIADYKKAQEHGTTKTGPGVGDAGPGKNDPGPKADS